MNAPINDLQQLFKQSLHELKSEVDRRDACWHSIIQQNADAIIIVDQDGIVRFANERAESLLTRNNDPVVGVRFGFPVAVNEPAEIQLLQSDCSMVVAEMRAVEIDWTDGRVFLATLRDITDRKKSEEQIRQLNQALTERVEELESFSYSVAHDLRAPLRAIESFSYILKTDTEELSGESKDLLDRVCDNTKRMQILLDGLLRYAQFTLKPVDRERIDLSALAREVLDELRPVYAPACHGVRISSLPPADGDPFLIRQALHNLISNALKFCHRVSPSVTIVGQECSDGVTVEVRDNGVGFDQEHSKKLFRIFERLHSAPEQEGTGIGLAIVERIIRRHGGRVWAQGRKGDGASFYFFLPRLDKRGQNGARPGASTA